MADGAGSRARSDPRIGGVSRRGVPARARRCARAQHNARALPVSALFIHGMISMYSMDSINSSQNVTVVRKVASNSLATRLGKVLCECYSFIIYVFFQIYNTVQFITTFYKTVES